LDTSPALPHAAPGAGTADVEWLFREAQRRAVAREVERLPETMTKTLHDAIESAQKEIEATYTKGGHTLNTQEIDVQISFAVTWDASAVFKFSILPISVNVGPETSLKTTDTVIVSFKKPGNGN
jgi:hypothetical protein